MTELVLDLRIDFPGFDLDVSHRFALESITALFGPSGCGKSTLLRLISGLERSAKGQLSFGNDIWLDTEKRIFVPPHRRGVGYVFQEAHLFPHLTVEGNLRYAAGRAAQAADAPPISMDETVAALDLQPLLERGTASLSGGERQRVAIGRTLLTRPRLLLMDEPLAALDMVRKADILPYIERLPEIFGVPVIYVTHSIDEAVRLAPRMVVLAGGRVVASGATTEVLERLDIASVPNRFEAGVVFTARVAGHDPQFHLMQLDLHGQAIELPMIGLPVGHEVRLRIRARDVSLATERPTNISIRNILSGTIVEVVEEPGTAHAETLVDVGGTRLRARITRASAAALNLAPGKPVFVLVKSVSFDGQSPGGESVR